MFVSTLSPSLDGRASSSRRYRGTRSSAAALLLFLAALAGNGTASAMQFPPPPADQPLPGTPDDLDRSLLPDDYVHPSQIAAKAFAPPEGARQVSRNDLVWVDARRGRVIIDGYVALQEGMLEMFACPAGTKEHESVVGVVARSRVVHAALLAVGAMPGTPVRFQPEYIPPTGQRIRIWVLWRDEEGKVHRARAQEWVRDASTDKELKLDWVFAGSSFWRDPDTGEDFYQADSGDLVCVANFSSATLDLPTESTQANAHLDYVAFTERIPPRGTPVRLVMVPIPLPADQPDDSPRARQKADPDEPPEEELVAPQASDEADDSSAPPEENAAQPASEPATQNDEASAAEPTGESGNAAAGASR